MKLPFLLTMLFFFGGCTHIRPHLSTMDFEPSSMELVGPVTGEAEHSFLLGMGPMGGDKEFVLAAVKDALKGTDADAIINIVADDRIKFTLFWLYYTREVKVSGIAVKFKNKAK